MEKENLKTLSGQTHLAAQFLQVFIKHETGRDSEDIVEKRQQLVDFVIQSPAVHCAPSPRTLSSELSFFSFFGRVIY